MFVHVSFLEWCSGETSALSLISGSFVRSYQSCDFEQLRAEGQAGPLSRCQIDFVADSLVVRHELDHATSIGKMWHVADCQDTLFACRLYHLIHRPFGRTHEQNSTIDGLLRC